MLEGRNAVYDGHFAGLERAWLRIYGMTTTDSESAEQCETKVKEIFEEIGVKVPDDVLDRAHRIGRNSKNKSPGVVEQAMIVKFVSWKYAVYCARKMSKDKVIQLDLTARRAKLQAVA